MKGEGCLWYVLIVSFRIRWIRPSIDDRYVVVPPSKDARISKRINCYLGGAWDQGDGVRCRGYNALRARFKVVLCWDGTD